MRSIPRIVRKGNSIGKVKALNTSNIISHIRDEGRACDLAWEFRDVLSWDEILEYRERRDELEITKMRAAQMLGELNGWRSMWRTPGSCTISATPTKP